MPGLGDAFVGGLSPEDWMLGGQAPPQNPPDQPWPSWLQKAQDLNNRDVAAYQGGGIAVPDVLQPYMGGLKTIERDK